MCVNYSFGFLFFPFQVREAVWVVVGDQYEIIRKVIKRDGQRFPEMSVEKFAIVEQHGKDRRALVCR